MPAFERDGVAFNYLDEGDPSGRPFVFAGDAPSGDRAQRRELRAPALVLASWQDPTHPHSYAEILARELPSAQLAELTPKAEDEGRHAADARGPPSRDSWVASSHLRRRRRRQRARRRRDDEGGGLALVGGSP